MPKRSNFAACSAKITKNAENQERQFKNLPFLCSLTFIMQHGVCKEPAQLNSVASLKISENSLYVFLRPFQLPLERGEIY